MFINIPNSSASLNYADVIAALGYVPVNLAGDVMLGYLVLNADPIVPLGAATKQYVDSVAQGLAIKGAARAATTANLASLSGLLTIDTVTLVAGDRVLVKNQLTPSQNGIYVAAAGAWSRATDMDTGAEAVSAFVFVTSGSVNQSTGWVQVTPAPITLGVTGLVFSQFSGAGTYTADGLGIILSGNQFQLRLDGTTLTKSALGLKVSTGGISDNEVSASAAISRSKIASGSANHVVINDGSGNLSSVAILPISKGGTNSGTSLNNNRAMISSGGAIVESSTTSTEIGYLSGVTSPLQTQINNITGSAITALTGDVSATGPGSVSGTVNTVGGSSAANIHSAELAANAATSLNTVSTIVKRDSSGNFSTTSISLNNLKFANSNTGTLGWNPSSNFSINLPTTQGSAGQYLYGDGSGNLNWINPLSNIDGGSPSSNYVSGQVIIGGTP